MRKISLYAVKLFSLAAVLFLTDSSVYSQGTGVPDPGFGNNGQVLNKISTNRNDISQSIAVTPDGKIVVSGNSFNSIGYSNNGIVRYKDNGKPDKSFNGTGTVIIKNTFANIVLAQPDN